MSLLKWIAFTLVGIVSVYAVESDAELGNWCGTVATEEWLAADYARAPSAKRQVVGQPSITVDTYFHVVTNSTRVQDGWLTDQLLNDQLQILNADYASSNISFRLQGISRTVNAAWATNGNTRVQLEMHKALREGAYDTLNIYFRTHIRSETGNTVNGYCTLPFTFQQGSENFYRDGCVVFHSTVPGRTVTHEVGHWFGLLHTFQGGCTGPGDNVMDTPAEALPSWDCNITRDTCPDQPGYDPVRNFMDYSTGSCRNNFTPGQIARMWGQWNYFRA
ncbi:hypothetical protein MFIFM68171_03641 [Madurella fahalii]|uniref:Peptidase M43 pregnancy-associated plasma-A domain-containing protein n=1 Tax=Madurella fahalii TaxID=1157608 RepID=A0ABQ0G6P1_9PEZI